MKNVLVGISTGIAVFLLMGCSEQPTACTEIGVMEGVGLNVVGPLAADAAKAMIAVCEGEECQAQEIEVVASSTAVPQDCEGTDPDDSCSATMVPDGNKSGFAAFANLPESEVRVTVSLWDENDTQIFLEETNLTPQRIYPNGPQCDNGGVQLGLTVTDDGIAMK